MNKQFGKLKEDGTVVFAPDKVRNSKGEEVSTTEQILRPLGFLPIVDERPPAAERADVKIRYTYVTDEKRSPRGVRKNNGARQRNIAIRVVYDVPNADTPAG